MSTNIYLHELRSRLRSVLTWSLSLAAIIFIFGSIFPTFADQASMIKEMMAKFPPELLAAFGMNNTDLSSVLGFFSFIQLFVMLCLSIQAGNYGFGLVSVEESELTADFLLSKPVSRVQILNSKLLAALTALGITNAALWVISFISISIFGSGRDYDLGVLCLLLVSAFIFQLFFLSVGLVISLLVKRVRSVTPYSMGLGFGTYVLAAFSGMLGDVKLEYLTPFKHFDPAFIANNSRLDTPMVLLNITVTVVSLAVSYWLYVRRDIPAVS